MLSSALKVIDGKIKTQTGMVEQIEKLLKTKAKKLDNSMKTKMELENGNR